MSTETEAQTHVHGGRLVAQRLRAHGVTKLFTLSGGHLFSIYDGCREEGIDIVDTRHEQAATFAAEGWAKVTREPGVAALTAGPGVTNGMSAMGSALQNRSPMVVLGGRAPDFRWGQGSLQEIDHVPFVRPLVKFAATAGSTAEIPSMVDDAFAHASTPHTGPAFVDLPLDHVFMQLEEDPGLEAPAPVRLEKADPEALDTAGARLREAERPVIMAGTNLYWGRAEAELVALAEALGIPVFLNGLGRGCVPADHDLAFSRARSAALKGADLALVIGVPMDFRLGFGGSFGEETKLIRLDVAPNALTANRLPDLDLVGDVAAGLAAIAAAAGEGTRSKPWLEQLGNVEREAREAEREQLEDSRSPLHPVRVYGELDKVLARDAIVVGDGGDFVSYAGRYINTYEPGCWMDPGPFGCLGAGPGQAIGAKVANPDRQVCLLLGDGAFGFGGMEFDTMARHGLGVVGVMGNNGIWALGPHPMKFLYGYSVAAELRPETRYDELVESLGCDGILVREPAQLRPALERAFSSGRPTLVNVLTDPEVAYPRKANLA